MNSADFDIANCKCPWVEITAQDRGPLAHWDRVTAEYFIVEYWPGGIPMYGVPYYQPGEDKTRLPFTKMKMVGPMTMRTVFDKDGLYYILFTAHNNDTGVWWYIDFVIVDWTGCSSVIDCPVGGGNNTSGSIWIRAVPCAEGRAARRTSSVLPGG